MSSFYEVHSLKAEDDLNCSESKMSELNLGLGARPHWSSNPTWEATLNQRVSVNSPKNGLRLFINLSFKGSRSASQSALALGRTPTSNS